MMGMKEHMSGDMIMMNQKMMEMMSKEDITMVASMKVDEKISILEAKIDYLKKMRDMLKAKM